MKKILIVTQSVDRNNPILGFFVEWIKMFSKSFERVTVICLQKGEFDFDQNVSVYSLGKENGGSKFAYTFRFYKYILSLRKEYDVVFVHMNPIYIVLGGLFWRLFGKKIGLWYVHRSVDLKLGIATLFAHYIFTASKESFRLNSRKVRIVGHGIDTDKFKPISHTFDYKIVTVGRITKTKNISRMIDVMKLLHATNKGYTLTVVGDSTTLSDLKYKSDVMSKAYDAGLNKSVFFVGSKNQDELALFLPKFDFFINLSDTGSVDKAVLEAASAGLNIITTNEAFRDMFGNVYVDTKNPDTLALKIMAIQDNSAILRGVVEDNYNLKSLVRKVADLYE